MSCESASASYMPHAVIAYRADVCIYVIRAHDSWLTSLMIMMMMMMII